MFTDIKGTKLSSNLGQREEKGGDQEEYETLFWLVMWKTLENQANKGIYV